MSYFTKSWYTILVFTVYCLGSPTQLWRRKSYQNKEQRAHSNQIYKLPYQSRAELSAVIARLMCKYFPPSPAVLWIVKVREKKTDRKKMPTSCLVVKEIVWKFEGKFPRGLSSPLALSFVCQNDIDTYFTLLTFKIFLSCKTCLKFCFYLKFQAAY